MKADGAARRVRQILRIEEVDHQEDLLGRRRTRRVDERNKIKDDVDNQEALMIARIIRSTMRRGRRGREVSNNMNNFMRTF